MGSAFRKISRVGSLIGGTKWYLSEDCLLAAKRMMYAVEYRRFFLPELGSIVVLPPPTWFLREVLLVGAFWALRVVFLEGGAFTPRPGLSGAGLPRGGAG